MKANKKIQIGELLIQNNFISREQLQVALNEQSITRKKLGRTLIDLHFIEEDTLLNFLAEQLRIPFIDIARYPRNTATVKLLPENVARRFRVLLLENNEHAVFLAMADPTDLMAVDELTRVLHKTVRLAIARETDLLLAIDQSYRRTDEINELAEQLRYELAGTETDLNQLLSAEGTADAPVVKLLKSVFEDAVQIRASDIHIEPQEQKLFIRFRIDGVLHLQAEADLKIAAALVLRLKLISSLDISEKRLPQDGRFYIKVRHQAVDVRLSTMPTLYGESIVMRLLIQNSGDFTLEKLGMSPDMLERFRRLIHRPNGMILMTGPTGSGKTTTLYAALNEINSTSNKIITLEDPVEYRMAGVNQVQINERIDLDFARVLRSALRQDPDIILIGEMRDQETAQIAMRAAMTGHLVLSTLHTNDTISTPMRIVDMGVPNFIVATSLLAVIAQRLLRLICKNCIEPYQPNAFEQTWLRATLKETLEQYSFAQGVGCTYCNGTGYQGRTGVYELLEMNTDLIDAIGHHDPHHFVKMARQHIVGKTLRYGAIELVIAQRTTITEAMRISNQFED
ncbi:MAG: GspE/PulE family protein [Methylococcaceae bacterium]